MGQFWAGPSPDNNKTEFNMLFVLGLLTFFLSVVSSKLIRADPEVVQGHGFAAPPSGHHPHPQPPPRRPNRVKTISQFDKPGGFHPGANPYAGVELGPSTEQVFVSGPPLGDEFLTQYQKLLENAQLNSKLCSIQTAGQFGVQFGLT